MNREPGSVNGDGSLNRESGSINSSLASTVLLDDGNDGQLLMDSSGLVPGQTGLVPAGGQVSSGPYYGLISPTTFASSDTGLVTVTSPSQVHFFSSAAPSTISASSNLISNSPTTSSSSAHVYYSIGEISESADRQSKPKYEEGETKDLFANIEII